MSSLNLSKDYNSHVLDSGELILFPKRYATYDMYQKTLNDSYPLLIEDLLNLCNAYITSASTISEGQRVRLQNKIEFKWMELGYRAPQDIFEKISQFVFTNDVNHNIMVVQNAINDIRAL